MWTHSERFLTITSRSLIMMFRCWGLCPSLHIGGASGLGSEGSTLRLCEQMGTLSQALPPLSWYTSSTHLALQYSDWSQILPAPLGPVISQPHSQSRWRVTWDRVSDFTRMVEPTALGRFMPCQVPLGGKKRKLGGTASQPAPATSSLPLAPLPQPCREQPPWARCGHSPPYPARSPKSWGIQRSAPGSPI